MTREGRRDAVFAMAALPLLVAAALAGCGGGEEPTGSSAQATTPGRSVPGQATGTPPPSNLAPSTPEPAWREAARELDMPVYRIGNAPGLVLASVVPKTGCGDDETEQVEATYTGPGGDLIRLYQGRPYFCGDLGVVRTLGTGSVGGRRAVFAESPNGDNRGGMLLRWYTAPRRERASGPGNEMMLEIRGRDEARALRIARGLRLVPKERPGDPAG